MLIIIATCVNSVYDNKELTAAVRGVSTIIGFYMVFSREEPPAKGTRSEDVVTRLRYEGHDAIIFDTPQTETG